MTHAGLLATAFALGCACTLEAQVMGQSVNVGARVRLSGPAVGPRPLVGRLRAMTNDSLTIERSGAGALAFARAAGVRLEVSRGRNRLGGAWRGLQYGALAGALIGVLVVETAEEDAGLAGPMLVVGAALVGAPVGAAVGAAAARERWMPVYRW